MPLYCLNSCNGRNFIAWAPATGTNLLLGLLQWVLPYCLGSCNGCHIIAWAPTMCATLLLELRQWAPLYCLNSYNGHHSIAWAPEIGITTHMCVCAVACVEDNLGLEVGVA